MKSLELVKRRGLFACGGKPAGREDGVIGSGLLFSSLRLVVHPRMLDSGHVVVRGSREVDESFGLVTTISSESIVRFIERQSWNLMLKRFVCRDVEI